MMIDFIEDSRNKFKEIFNNHISISSTGGLPLHVSKTDFLKGFSAPTHPELMRVFKDLELVEQL